VIAAGAVARHFGAALAAARLLLNSAAFGRALLGEQRMQSFATAVRKVSGNKIPEWNRWIPNAAANSKLRVTRKFPEEVVYFPSCVSRLFGASSPNVYQGSQRECLEQLLEKARYSIRYPKNLSNLCCGMAFSSKGFSRHAELKMQELAEELRNVTEQGRIPVMVDTSPCALRIKEKLEGLPIHDIGGFLNKYVIPRVQITSKRQNIAVHVPCSVRNTPEQNELLTLAEKCSTNVFTPESVPCCGFAGDRGFTHPELTASALVTLKRDLPKSCEVGHSTSRTCEIGLSRHGGISYQSIAYLVNESTEGYQ